MEVPDADAIARENVRLREALARAALIVHDLRNPTNGIMLASRVRLRSTDALASDRQHWQNVYTSAESIHRTAMNLLDMMHSEDGTFTPRLADVPLPKLLADVADQMTPLAAAQSVWLAVDAIGSPASLRCDEELVRRVLQNLIDNALHYSPENGTVRLIARASQEHLELRVIDEGPGIPEDDRAVVFEKWSQHAHGAEPGRGLGLAFCRLAAGAHGGTIEIEANAPRGAVFVVRLPLVRTGS